MLPALFTSKVRLLPAIALATILCWLPACRGGNSHDVYAVYTGGNWQRGRELIVKYRCGACHVIPGSEDANGKVGPPLLGFAQRTYIGGELPNSPENLVRWLLDPKRSNLEPQCQTWGFLSRTPAM